MVARRLPCVPCVTRRRAHARHHSALLTLSLSSLLSTTLCCLHSVPQVTFSTPFSEGVQV